MLRKRRYAPLKRQKYAVYSLPANWEYPVRNSGIGESLWATPQVIEELFASDSKLKRRFLGFLRRDCCGVIHHLGGEWLSYAWMTKRGRNGPVHMPQPPEEDYCWIFHCGTKPAFRGQGLYKQSLFMLAVQARGCSKLLIDTEVDNLSSRAAIVSVGFQPYGLVSTWTLAVPKIKSWNFAKWQQNQTLSGMECRAA